MCGSTGTGKSQLAVELAASLSGRSEIISADSMQLYKGLDAITNKVTDEEMQGIPHHLISFLDPKDDAEYDVGSFVRDARRVIADVEAKDRVPIVVGGTTYYLQHLLLPGRLVSVADEERHDASSRQMSREEVERRVSEVSSEPLREEQLVLLHEIVNMAHSSTGGDSEPIEVWNLLRCLDEPMARRWHYRDRRKVTRSLKVLFETGMRHSDLIELQEEQEQAEEQERQAPEHPSRVLIFYLECEREVLNERLNARVEKMIDVSGARRGRDMSKPD